VIGRKHFFLFCIAIFTASSLPAEWLPLANAAICPVLQGAARWSPAHVQAIMADSFPPKMRGMAFALYGLTHWCAGTGPTWVMDYRPLFMAMDFLMNLPIVCWLWVCLQSRGRSTLLRRFRRVRCGSIMWVFTAAAGRVALQIFLDKDRKTIGLAPATLQRCGNFGCVPQCSRVWECARNSRSLT